MSEFSSQEERFAKVSPYFSTRCFGNTAGLEKSYVVDREIVVFGDVSANQTSEIRDTRRRERWSLRGLFRWARFDFRRAVFDEHDYAFLIIDVRGEDSA